MAGQPRGVRVGLFQLVQSPPPPTGRLNASTIQFDQAAVVPTVPAHRRSAALTSLYASLVALQGLDVHSTSRALASGAGRESNPAMRGIVGNPALMIATKASTTGMAIWATGTLRKKHPRAAVGFIAALNSAMAIVVARNYSIR